jgi:hypothetical protein
MVLLLLGSLPTLFALLLCWTPVFRAWRQRMSWRAIRLAQSGVSVVLRTQRLHHPLITQLVNVCAATVSVVSCA